METRKILDWNLAEEHLKAVADQRLHEGSLGINRFMIDVEPYWKRYWDGERTEELFNAIMRLN
jgi:hypothetical protein